MNYTGLYESEIKSLSNTDQEYKVDLGKVLTKAFDLTKDNLGTIWLVNILMFIITIFLMLTLVGILAMPALRFSYAIITKKLLDGEPVSISDIFRGFDYFVPTLKVGLAYWGIGLLLMSPFLLFLIPVIASGGDEQVIEQMAPIFFMLYMVFVLFLSIGGYAFQALFGLAPYFKVFGNLGTVQAFKHNYRFGKKRFWMWVILMLAGGMLGGIAIYFFLLGLHFLEFLKAIAFFDAMEQQKGTEDDLITKLEATL